MAPRRRAHPGLRLPVCTECSYGRTAAEAAPTGHIARNAAAPQRIRLAFVAIISFRLRFERTLRVDRPPCQFDDIGRRGEEIAHGLLYARARQRRHVDARLLRFGE